MYKSFTIIFGVFGTFATFSRLSLSLLHFSVSGFIIYSVKGKELTAMTETNNKPKVILLNGSAHSEGTTYRALKEVADTLINEGIDAEIIHVGHLVVRGCSECYACGKLKKCVHDDIVNEIAEKFKESQTFAMRSVLTTTKQK